MDLSGLLLSQNLALPSQQQGFLGSEEGLGSGENGFGDLLGLVESLEVAESGESLESADLLKTMIAGVADPEADLVFGQKAASLARLQAGNLPGANQQSLEETLGENLGQALDQTAEQMSEQMLKGTSNQSVEAGWAQANGSSAEALAGVATSQLNAGKIVGHHSGDEMTFQSNVATSDLSAELFSRSAQGSLAMNLAKNQQAEKLGFEQVSAWSQGLSSGEIKSVDLMRTPDTFQMQKQNVVAEAQQGLAENSKMPNSFEQTQGQNRMNQAQQVIAPAALRSGAVDESTQSVAKSEMSTLNKADPSLAKDSGVSLGSVANKSESSSSEGRSESGSKDSQSGESQFARDFLLGRSLANEAAKSNSASTSLKTPEISSEVIDFVADRVNHLQKVGGESLRVKMDSAGLGELEIKVTVRRGVVDVSIRSDAEHATSALKSSGAELKAKLEQVVELGDLDISTGIAEKHALRIGAQASKAQLGSDFASLSAEAVDGGDFGLKDSSRSNDSGSFDRRDDDGSSFAQREQSFSNGGNREEKRDEAMDQWRNVFEARKTA